MKEITDKMWESNPQLKSVREYQFDDIADLKRNYSAVLNLTFSSGSGFFAGQIQPFPVGDPHIGNLEHVLLLNPRIKGDEISKICYFDIVDIRDEKIRGMLRYNFICGRNEAIECDMTSCLKLVLNNDSSKRYNIQFLPLKGYILYIWDISEDDERDDDPEEVPLPQQGIGGVLKEMLV